MCYRFLWSAVCAITALSLGQGVADDSDGFTPLFNEKDLAGWVLVNTPKTRGRLRMACSCVPENRLAKFGRKRCIRISFWKWNGGIWSPAETQVSLYGRTTSPLRVCRFIAALRFRFWKIPTASHNITRLTATSSPFTGVTLTPVNGRGGGRAFPTEERSLPSPQWNHYRIECRDGAISLAVNHKVVTQATDATPRKGYICLESEGGVVHYRNLRIQELPETLVAPEHVAVANRGFVSLYSGLDLRGWNVAEAEKEHWHVNDWVLAFDGKTASGSTAFVTTESFASPMFVLDLRPMDGFVSLSIGDGSFEKSIVISTADTAWKPLLEKRDWIRLETSVRENLLTLSANGNPIVTNLPLPNKAVPLSLKISGPAELANIYGIPKR